MVKKLSAEFLGSLFLGASIIGSGIMGSILTRDIAIQLFINMSATVFMLFLIITLFGPISGGHFNPVVTFAEMFQKRMSIQLGIYYVLVQVIGGTLGVFLANLMFNRQAIDPSTYNRSGNYLFLSEVVATAGLILIIHLLRYQNRGHMTAGVLAAWIGTAYFFTSSTSFANPAITLARTWSDSFSGISMKSVPMFILAQLIGAALGVLLTALLTAEKKEEDVFA